MTLKAIGRQENADSGAAPAQSLARLQRGRWAPARGGCQTHVTPGHHPGNLLGSVLTSEGPAAPPLGAPGAKAPLPLTPPTPAPRSRLTAGLPRRQAACLPRLGWRGEPPGARRSQRHNRWTRAHQPAPRALRAPHAPLKTTPYTGLTFTHRVSEEHMTDPMQASDQLRNLSDKKKHQSKKLVNLPRKLRGKWKILHVKIYVQTLTKQKKTKNKSRKELIRHRKSLDIEKRWK